jgi:hypothetical protein
MFNQLSSGTKISITRSIKTAFEQYMAKISWDEDKYELQDFVQLWRTYINESASWFNNLDDQIKNDPKFHEELAVKINETIEKILSEPPTEEQMNEIDSLQKDLGTDYDYSCKVEAKFLLDKLQGMAKKN